MVLKSYTNIKPVNALILLKYKAAGKKNVLNYLGFLPLIIIDPDGVVACSGNSATSTIKREQRY